MKKALAFAFTIAMLAPAAAQSFSLPPILFDMPQTIPWVDANGGSTGTATISGGRMYMRNHKGEHVATIVNADGKITVYDPSGKIIDRKDK